jgi:hypothetical protein
MDLAVRYHRVPVQPKPLQTLPTPVGIVDGTALSAAGAEERSAGIGDGAAAAADFSNSSLLATWMWQRTKVREASKSHAFCSPCPANTRVRRMRRTPRHDVAAGPQRAMDGEVSRCEQPSRRRTSAANVEAEHVVLAPWRSIWLCRFAPSDEECHLASLSLICRAFQIRIPGARRHPVHFESRRGELR